MSALIPNLSLGLSLLALLITIWLNNRSNAQTEIAGLNSRVGTLERKLADCEIREEHHLQENLFLMRQMTLAGLEHIIKHQSKQADP